MSLQNGVANAQSPVQTLREIDHQRNALLNRIADIRAERGEYYLSRLGDTYRELFNLDYDDPRSPLGAALAMQNADDEVIIEILFQMVVQRKPDDEAMTRCKKHMGKHADDRRRAVEDIIWALINTKEFLDRVR